MIPLAEALLTVRIVKALKTAGGGVSVKIKLLPAVMPEILAAIAATILLAFKTAELTLLTSRKPAVIPPPICEIDPALFSLTIPPVPLFKLDVRINPLPLNIILPLSVVLIGPATVSDAVSSTCTLPPLKLLIPLAAMIKGPMFFN